MRVLVVDDEIAITDLLADVLSDEGYEVAKAHDGRTALAMLRDGLRPQVIITDLMMPNLDGVGLYHAVRDEFPKDQIGIILMSAGKQTHINDSRTIFLPKPFSIMELLDAIERLA